MKNILGILLIVFIYSCSKGDNSSISQYDLKVNKNIFLDNGKCLEIIDKEYEICLISINDSRCPSGGECVWEGDAVVEFNFKSKLENKSFSLHTNDELQQDTIINNLKIKLLNVLPYPTLNNHPINQSDYSAELIIFEE